jgi:hypothetical protein
MWLRTLDVGTDSFQSLLYKGHKHARSAQDDEVDSRTPSLWFTPHSRRIAVRVSTEADHNIGPS